MTNLQEIEHPSLDKQAYESQLRGVQMRLMRFQQAVFNTKRKVVIAVEGIDASGKGGMLKRLTALMDPRGVSVHAIGAPNTEELEQHYLQRFWQRLPPAGHISVFDRTWYGRVLVERIETTLGEDKWQRAYQEINQFEQQLTDDGIILVKMLLVIDEDEQKERFLDRLNDPIKNWKITQADLNTRQQWHEYQQAYQDMLNNCSPSSSPWHIIPANNKRYARCHSAQVVCDALAHHIDLDNEKYADAEFIQQAIAKLEQEPRNI